MLENDPKTHQESIDRSNQLESEAHVSPVEALKKLVSDLLAKIK